MDVGTVAFMSINTGISSTAMSAGSMIPCYLCYACTALLGSCSAALLHIAQVIPLLLALRLGRCAGGVAKRVRESDLRISCMQNPEFRISGNSMRRVVG